MPSWNEILKEIEERVEQDGNEVLDKIRRKYLLKLYEETKRNVIIYAVNWTQPKDFPSHYLNISEEDIQGLMAVVHGLEGDELDLIIHSPGGLSEPAEAIVNYLRQKFNHIRAIIPYAAMSAATMIACACDEIIMGNHSFIGPIDPQFILKTKLGRQPIPAKAILEQFNLAKNQCTEDINQTIVWHPILEQYGPSLLVQADDSIKLAKDIVTNWLNEYMFSNDEDSNVEKIVEYLVDENKELLSHSRHISKEKAKESGLKVIDLEDNQEVQDYVLSIYHATTITFDKSPTYKIIENHKEKAFIKSIIHHKKQ